MSSIPKLELANTFSEWLVTINTILDLVNFTSSNGVPGSIATFDANGTLSITSFALGSTGTEITEIREDFSIYDHHSLATTQAIYDLLTGSGGSPLPISTSSFSLSSDPNTIITSISTDFSSVDGNTLVTTAGVYDLLTGNSATPLPIEADSFGFDDGSGVTVNSIATDFSSIDDSSLVTANAVYNLLTDGSVPLNVHFETLTLKYGQTINNIANNFNVVDDNTIVTSKAVYSLVSGFDGDPGTINANTLTLENGVTVNTISDSVSTNNSYSLLTANAISNYFNESPLTVGNLVFNGTPNTIIDSVATDFSSISDSNLVTSNAVYNLLTDGTNTLDLVATSIEIGGQQIDTIATSLISNINDNTVATTEAIHEALTLENVGYIDKEITALSEKLTTSNAVYKILTANTYPIPAKLHSLSLQNSKNVTEIANNFYTLSDDYLVTVNAVYGLIDGSLGSIETIKSNNITLSNQTINSIVTVVDSANSNDHSIATVKSMVDLLTGNSSYTIDLSGPSITIGGITANAIATTIDLPNTNQYTLGTTQAIVDLISGGTGSNTLYSVNTSILVLGGDSVDKIVKDFTVANTNHTSVPTTLAVIDLLNGNATTPLTINPSSLTVGNNTITEISNNYSADNNNTILTANAVHQRFADLIGDAPITFQTLGDLYNYTDSIFQTVSNFSASLGGDQDFVATGAISEGQIVGLRSDGTVEVVKETITTNTENFTIVGKIPNAVDAEATYIPDISGIYIDELNTVVMMFPYGSNNNALIAGIVSDGTITWGSRYNYDTIYDGVGDLCWDENAKKIVVVWRGASSSFYGKARVATIDGTVITYGNEITFETEGAHEIKCVYHKISKKIVIFYQLQSDADTGHAIVGQVLGTGLTFGNRVKFHSGSYDDSRVICNPNGTIIAHYKSTSGYPTLQAFYVDGFNISYGTPTTYFSQNEYIGPVLWDENYNRAIVMYNTSSSSSSLRSLTINGLTITNGSILASGIINSSGPHAHGTIIPNTNKIILVMDNSGSEYITGDIGASSITMGSRTSILNYYGDTYIVQEMPNIQLIVSTSTGIYNPDEILLTTDADIPTTNADSWLGIASQNISDGETGTVTILSGVNESQTGLIPGASYYVNYDGTLTTTENSGPLLGTYGKIGRALSSTKLLITEGNA